MIWRHWKKRWVIFWQLSDPKQSPLLMLLTWTTSFSTPFLAAKMETCIRGMGVEYQIVLLLGIADRLFFVAIYMMFLIRLNSYIYIFTVFDLWWNLKYRVQSGPGKSWKITGFEIEIYRPGISWNFVFKSRESWKFTIFLKNNMSVLDYFFFINMCSERTFRKKGWLR